MLSLQYHYVYKLGLLLFFPLHEGEHVRNSCSYKNVVLRELAQAQILVQSFLILKEEKSKARSVILNLFVMSIDKFSLVADHLHLLVSRKDIDVFSKRHNI